MPSIRYHVKPRDAPAAVAARALGVTLAMFEEKLPQLLARGFPCADPTTGLFDLVAIDRWQDARHPQFLGLDGAQNTGSPSFDSLPIRERLKALAKPAAGDITRERLRAWGAERKKNGQAKP